MRDTELTCFISEFGEATHRKVVPDAALEKYSGILPNKLLNYWKEEGWCGYADGLFWTVNPERYDGVLSMLLEGTGLNDFDTYHVFARSAFGYLVAWGQNTKQFFKIMTPHHMICLDQGKLKESDVDPDVVIGGFFILSRREDFDIDDAGGTFLFGKALQRCGALAEEELYAFEPALSIGGTVSIENLHKAPIHAHLAMLSQLAPTKIVGYDTSLLVQKKEND